MQDRNLGSREHAAARDGHAAEELVELLVVTCEAPRRWRRDENLISAQVVTDGELDVARDD